MSRISIEVHEDQHAKIKIMASLQNQSIKDFIIDRIFNEPGKEFNQATIEAIEEMQNEKSLNIYNSVDALFAKFDQ